MVRKSQYGWKYIPVIKASFVLLYLLISASAEAGPNPDSLAGKSYQYLIERLNSKQAEKVSLVYSQSYLEKAKKEKNWPEVANAYKSFIHNARKELRLRYADSMVHAASKSRNDSVIGSAHLTRGIVYYNLKQHARALDNYLLADRHISRIGDLYLEHKVKFNIAQIKYYLGFYNEAYSLFKACSKYYKEEEEELPYLSSLHSLGLCLNRLGNFEKCSAVNKLGLEEAARLRQPEVIAHFLHSEGVNQYFTKAYSESINKLLRSFPEIRESGDFANEAVANFYLGKDYWALGRRDEAVAYFLKVDKIYLTHQYIRPDLRENYELLISYYAARQDLEKQLFYINRLLEADKLLNENYKYLSDRIHKEYDTRELLNEKLEIEKSLASTKLAYILSISILLPVIAALVYWNIRTKKRNRKKYEELRDRKKEEPNPKQRKAEDGTLDINPEVVASVLKQLDKFEKNEKFLKPDLTQAKLANMFGSNTKYVSMIIWHYRNKKSTDYVNDLRIDYIIERLKTDSRLRNYTNKALAEEAGFSTTQHFTRAFAAKEDISPSYFIDQLKKEQGLKNENTPQM